MGLDARGPGQPAHERREQDAPHHPPHPHDLAEVLTVPTGPAVFHTADSSPVTLDKPASAGELLTVSVSGLGPVRPNLDPGKPSPTFTGWTFAFPMESNPASPVSA